MCKLKKDRSGHVYAKLLLSSIEEHTPSDCDNCPLYNTRLFNDGSLFYKRINCNGILKHVLDIKRYKFLEYKKKEEFIKILNQMMKSCKLQKACKITT